MCDCVCVLHVVNCISFVKLFLLNIIQLVCMCVHLTLKYAYNDAECSSNQSTNIFYTRRYNNIFKSVKCPKKYEKNIIKK